jgi:nucleoside-triphosphatase THEP1
MARWALLSEENGEARANRALAIVEHFAAASVRVAGFVQRKRVDPQGPKRYEVVRLRDHETVALAVGGPMARGPAGENICTLAFHDGGFDAARRWLEEDAPGADVLVLDGIGKVEASGRGHAAALDAALRQPDKVVLICARASLLFSVVERFGLEEETMVAALELPADEAAMDAFVRAISEACPARPAPR